MWYDPKAVVLKGTKMMRPKSGPPFLVLYSEPLQKLRGLASYRVII